MSTARFIDLGLLPYREAHDLQLRANRRRYQGELDHDLFMAVEHPPVYALGRRGGSSYLQTMQQRLADGGIDIHPTERGGDITYHGPGQLVVYPIVKLKAAGLSVTDYVHLLEEAMLATANDFAVPAKRNPRNHGIWVEQAKLGSIGVAIRHGITFHGLALNVDMDLTPFTHINPCGLIGITMTSLSQELAQRIDLSRVKLHLGQHLIRLFGYGSAPSRLTDIWESRP
jgi:lipoyl(octanoyl) transferase